jgi:hypothetical protein
VKKILKGSVLITEQGEHFWVIEHIKGFIKALNESGKEQNVAESVAQNADIIPGKDAMATIKEYWYK